MGTYNIRLGSMLSFDEEQEKDIIKAIEALNASHKTGQFVSNLIRIALDNPEILDIKDGKYEKGAIIKQMERVGMSYNRYTFITQVTKEVEAMTKKVDSIYEMVNKLYILAQMGKHLGLEEKTENLLSAEFILERQVKELQDTLGISLTSSMFASNKKEDTKKKAEDALEYIIETYDNILNELKNSIKVEVPVQQVPVQVQQMPAQQIPVQQITQETYQVDTTQNIKEENTNKVEEVKDNDHEVIDFGDADTAALLNFFGNS